MELFAVDLDLQGNILTKLPDGIVELQYLNRIDLSNNSFSSFPDQLLNVPNLQHINISSNQITGIYSNISFYILHATLVMGHHIGTSATMYLRFFISVSLQKVNWLN